MPGNTHSPLIGEKEVMRNHELNRPHHDSRPRGVGSDPELRMIPLQPRHESMAQSRGFFGDGVLAVPNLKRRRGWGPTCLAAGCRKAPVYAWHDFPATPGQNRISSESAVFGG